MVIHRPRWREHPHVRTGKQLSFGERCADVLKAAFGTWSLLGAIIGGIIFWMMAVHDPGELHLNLALSFLASVQGVILQIAANRGDRINSELAMHTFANGERLLTINENQTLMLQQVHSMQRQLSQLTAEQPAPDPGASPEAPTA